MVAYPETTTVVGPYTPLVHDGHWLRATFDDTDNDVNRLGCRRLACAVIGQAIHDMRAETVNKDRDRERDAALSFLVSTAHEWAKQRGFWANIADMDPNVLAERARGMIR